MSVVTTCDECKKTTPKRVSPEQEEASSGWVVCDGLDYCSAACRVEGTARLAVEEAKDALAAAEAKAKSLGV